MPLKVQWMVKSVRSITQAEKESLLALVGSEAKRPWQRADFPLAVLGGSGAIAAGGTTMPEDVSNPDWPLLLASLTALRRAVDDITVEISGDLSLIAWDEESRSYQTVGWERAAAAPPVEVVKEDPSADEQEVDRLYADIEAAGFDTWDLRKQLDELSAEVVVRRGLLRLPSTPHPHEPTFSLARHQVASAISSAAQRLPDPAVVEAAIAAAWEANPDEQYAPALAEALMPLVASYAPLHRRAAETATASDTSPRWRAAAIRLLGATKQFAAESAALLVSRAQLDRGSGEAPPWREELLNGLDRLGHPDSFATLVLAAADEPSKLFTVVSGLPRAGGGRAISVLRRLRGVLALNKDHVVRGLASIAGPGVTPEITAEVIDALFSYAGYPKPEVRVQVAEALEARGRLAEVMAIWKTLDAAGHESFYRRYALRRLGRENAGESAAEDPVDWDALAREKGLSLPEVPPVPPVLERLLASESDLRGDAANALEKGAPPEHLLAMAVVLGVEEALRAAGKDYRMPSWYPWRDRLAELGCTAERDEDITAWILANASPDGTGVLPPQKMTPALLAAQRDPAGAAAAIAGAERPFSLGAEERAALLAEEAAIASRARLPELVEGPAPPPGADLFPAGHPETPPPRRGPATEPVFSREAGARYPVWTATDGLIEIVDGLASLTLSRGIGDPSLMAVAVVRRRTRWLRFDSLELVLRDEHGQAVATGDRHDEVPLIDPDRFGIHLYVPPPALDAARTAELRAVVREPFQIRAGHFRLGAVASIEQAGPLPLERLADPQEPALPGLQRAVIAQASCRLLQLRDSVEVDLVLELGLSEPAFAVTPVDVAVAFRGAGGKPLGDGSFTQILPADGSTRFIRRLFNARVAKAERLEIVVRGARTVMAPLARFALDDGAAR
jgi:hypothetical protein